LILKNVLVINYYGEDSANPGGRRSLFWRDFFSRYNNTNVSVLGGNNTSISNKGDGFVKRYFNRLVSLISSSCPMKNDLWLLRAKGELKSGKYDYVVFCCPVYEVCELIESNAPYVQIVDIRDGIHHESLLSSIECMKYKKYLQNLEFKLTSANVITTNIPGLRHHYQNLLSKKVHLIFNKQSHGVIETDCSDNSLNILYAGGLLKSSRGQNITRFLMALKEVRKFRKVTFTIIGRLNILEKVFYQFLYREIELIDEVSHSELEELIPKYNCMLVVNTVKRDLLPTKFWLYLKTNAFIFSVGHSYSYELLANKIEGAKWVDNDLDVIAELMKNINVSEKYPNRLAEVEKDDTVYLINELNDLNS
jgi:hypothetical protein